MIYLDYNATSPLLPAVKAAMEAVGDGPLNAASVHSAGRRAKKLLEEARASIAHALGAFPNEVLFTSSGSEANNMVLRSFAADRALLVGATEHASILKTASLLGGAVIPVQANGVIDLEVLEKMLSSFNSPPEGESTRHSSASVGGAALEESPPGFAKKANPAHPQGVGKGPLVSIQLANNETGVIQPIREIASIVHAHGGLLHTDAVQALGKIPLDWGLLGADMLSLCAHKAGGPVGAGALLIRNDLPIKPLISGGAQELGRRAGTENIHAIVGFAELVKQVAHFPDASKWSEWRDWLEAELLQAAPEALAFGKTPVILSEAKNPTSLKKDASALPQHDRLPNTLMVSMPGVKSETQLMHFDLAGFCVSSGSACSSGKMATSHVLLAMGVAPEIASTALRISYGWGTIRAEVEAFATAWKAAYTKLGKRKAA